jgi:serine/threonine-protein kinase
LELPVGSTVGRFRVDAEIGRGGYAIVYKAFDLLLERDVALKTVRRSRTRTRGASTGWCEARALSAVTHPHVVSLFDVVREGEGDVLVMELVNGTTLSDLTRTAPLEPTTVIALGLQLAEGLEAIHDAGIVHGDIKPGNLRLTPDGELKILDLGVAVKLRNSAAAPAPRPRTLAGTVPYMSPERLQGTSGDARADIWSAGAVLYELATGQRAVDSLTSSSLIRFVCKGVFPQRWQLARQIPNALADVIARAMAPDPSERYQSARELSEALESAALLLEDVLGRASAEKHPVIVSSLEVSTALTPLDHLSTTRSKSHSFMPGWLHKAAVNRNEGNRIVA